MRIPIRVQLALLVLMTSLLALAVISISTVSPNAPRKTSDRYRVGQLTPLAVGLDSQLRRRSQGLALTASLKAAQIASDLQLVRTTCGTIVTRILLQQAVGRFYTGNNTDANWVRAISDIDLALASGGSTNLLQAIVYSRNATGEPHGILNVTGSSTFLLPYDHINGSAVMLGDADSGFPPMLYPNITYVMSSAADPNHSGVNLTTAYAFPEFPLTLGSVLLLGPMQVNTSFAMISLTLPIVNLSSSTDILGFLTIVAEASMLYTALTSKEGLQSTGIVLLLGPADADNRFTSTDEPTRGSNQPNATALQSASVDFVFPPTPIPGQPDRHPAHNINGSGKPFPLSNYPAALKAFSNNNTAVNNASSELSTTNEAGYNVAVGWARPPTTLVDWVLLVEQAHSEAWSPINELRKILLACVFGTAGLIMLLVIPMAHVSVLPIRRLKEATQASVQPPGYTPPGSIMSDVEGYVSGDEENSQGGGLSKHKTGFMVRLRDLRRGRRRKSKAEHKEDVRRRVFKIPARVQDKKHLIKDELTDLTTTFNAMSDELMMQYQRLEEKVAERTQELELSKKAAEAANESKTLFIANISHELKTPLNGILGMCAVCMGEDDLPRIKRSLQVVYKSGDLLLHLLNDLLTFSKNQIGQSLTLEEKEFGLSDIKSQIETIFDKQVKEGHIKFSVSFLSSESSDCSPETLGLSSGKPLPTLGPAGTGRMKDMRLWGDQHRILQVLINLVSNSLKFTPEGGRVEVRIKYLGEAEGSHEGSRNSLASKPGSQRPSRNRHRVGSDSNKSTQSKNPSISSSTKPLGTALLINPMDPKTAQTHVQVRERSMTPPPINARTLTFEFEVEDTGPGIAPALQERVFEPFVQGDLGLSKKYGGTGLGLSICSQLAGLMGGQIGLQSAVGVGTTFNMRIPLKFVKERASSTTSSSRQGSRSSSIAGKDEPRSSHRGSAEISGAPNPTLTPSAPMTYEKDPQPRLVGLSQPFFAASPSGPSSGTAAKDQLAALDAVAANKSPTGKIRVLVAEDNLVNQEVVLRMLKLEDIYDVTVAKDGQEAYDMVKASMDAGTMYNLIFMDIQMPNLDGLQSTRLIRQMGYSAPIVALSAFSEESNVKECIDSGMDMFLSKPIRRPALKQVLKKFAPIPEESETVSLKQKATSSEDGGQMTQPS
ncbi:MAG: Histidine kinase [Claussenomyces sp. TS43310]|nr:MAG: Histidine kinase [Claussenomyces sp. TS43310]